MSLSYSCLIDLGQEVEGELDALHAEAELRGMLEHIRASDGPDARFDQLDDGAVIYDVGDLINHWQGCKSDSSWAGMWETIDVWIKHLEMLRKNKVFLMWVSW